MGLLATKFEVKEFRKHLKLVYKNVQNVSTVMTHGIVY